MKQWLVMASLLCLCTITARAQDAPPAAGLSLQQAIDIALERNHDARLAALAIRGAEAAAVIAGAPPNPSLTVQTSAINPRTGIGAGSLRDKNVDTVLQLSQLIERGGKRALRQENAGYLAQASRLDFNDVRRQLHLTVAQAYFDLLAAQDRIATTRQSVGLFDQTLDAARRRKQAGDIAGADVDKLQVDALRVRNDARQAEADLARAQSVLAVLLGSTDPESLRAADPWPSAAAPGTPDDVERIIAQRPDIRAAQARIQAAEAARRLALALRTRDVTVGMQYEHVPGTENNNTYGVTVQIPLFVRYQYQGEIFNAETALDTARENFEKVRSVARNEVMRAWRDLQAAADRVQRFERELLVAAKRSADAAEYGFRNGASGVMDVLDARRTYRLTQLDAVAARADYAKALAAWRAAVMEGMKQ